MAESLDTPQDINFEGLSLVRLARYGVYLTPSEELNKVVTSFLNENAKRRIGKRVLRLGVAPRLITVRSDSGKSGDKITASIDKYSRSIEPYASGRQFRVQADGFTYVQERTRRRAVTTLLFDVATSPEMCKGIIKPPFFEPGTAGPLQARIVFSNEDVVPFADLQAQAAEEALTAKHPSARDGLAPVALCLSGLEVTKREVLPYPSSSGR